MIYIKNTSFVIISWLEKDHSMTEKCRLKNVITLFQTALSLVLWRKISSNQFKWNQNISYTLEQII